MIRIKVKGQFEVFGNDHATVIEIFNELPLVSPAVIEVIVDEEEKE